jgi:predicted ATP-grasp superfamily ATP-dependent carboligase
VHERKRDFMAESEILLIVGASARAAAFSALRAGRRPWCVDLFADDDLRARCPAQVIATKDYPRGLIRYFRDAPPGPWIYTGALENHPQLIEQLSRERALWGNSAEVLRRVRSPFDIARVLKAAGIPCPEVRMRPDDLAPTKRWLVKPLAGAGGTGINFCRNGEKANRRRAYYQEFIEGPPRSAAFCVLSPSPPASGAEGWSERLGMIGAMLSGMDAGEHAHRRPAEEHGTNTSPCGSRPHPDPHSPASGERGAGSVQLLGVTEQLIGESWLNARPFHWCGNIGPIPISTSLQARLELLGEVLVREFGLCGLFGIDFILRGDQPWPVEINPRYTGAVEVLEYASGESFLGESSPIRGLRIHSPMVGKAILFAERDFRLPNDGPWMEVLRTPAPIEQLPAFADIPAGGTFIEAGQPVLTIFAQGNTVAECRQSLRGVATNLRVSTKSP